MNITSRTEEFQTQDKNTSFVTVVYEHDSLTRYLSAYL